MKDVTLKGTVLNGNENAQKLIIQVNVPFTVLRKRCRFTYMDEPETDPGDSSAESSNRFYQRRVDPDRTREISKFIWNTIVSERKGNSVAVIFPTAMLLAATLEDTDLKIGNECDITFSGEGQDIFIIDGQHRLSGMIHLYDRLCGDGNSLFSAEEMLDDDALYVKNYLERYSFNCSLLLNFDLWEQAQVFADVNFNQKKVSKNLYYSIYGMQYPETNADLKKNYIYIAHTLVRLLNTNAESPFHGLIRMLGPGKGLISQSFLADSLIRNIRFPRGIWYNAVTQPKPRLRPIAVECVSFFKAVKDTFPEDWPAAGVQRSILTKTTGLGAMIRTLEYLHRFVLRPTTLDRIQEVTEGYFCQDYYEEVKGYLMKVKRQAPDIFSFKGQFAGTGGSGLEKKLFDMIVSLI